MPYQKFKDYRLGEEKLQKCGLKAKITEYRLAGDMTVQFEDGKIVDHVDYYAFVNGNLNYNKTAREQSVKSHRVGEKCVCSNEMIASIIAYRNHYDIDIQFDDGLVVEHISYARFYQCSVPHPDHKPVMQKPKLLKRHIGLKKRTLDGYRELLDVHDDGTVDYLDDDGSVVTNAYSWDFYRKNTVLSNGRRRGDAVSVVNR